MTPDAIREFVGHAFVDVYVEKLDSGYSFWLEKKQVAPYSTRLIRVRKVGSGTRLKRAASSLHEGRELEGTFSGGLEGLRKILEEQISLVPVRRK
jgi:hypothetical protein